MAQTEQSCPGPGRSLQIKDANRPPATRVSSYDRHEPGLLAQGTGRSEHPGGGRRAWSPTPPGGTGISLEIAADRELGREPGGQGTSPTKPSWLPTPLRLLDSQTQVKRLGKSPGTALPTASPDMAAGRKSSPLNTKESKTQHHLLQSLLQIAVGSQRPGCLSTTPM